MLSKTIELLSTSLVAQKKEAIKKKAWLCSACLELFLAQLRLLQLVTTCSRLFPFSKAMVSQNVSTCKFMLDIVTKWDNFLCCKPGEMALQSRTGITKQGNFYYKVGKTLSQSGVGITKWDFITKQGSTCIISFQKTFLVSY